MAEAEVANYSENGKQSGNGRNLILDAVQLGQRRFANF